MACAQRRIGPLNLGRYGILSSLINGCNLIISQFLLTKVHIHFGFQSFPIFFLLFSLAINTGLSPFFLVDCYLPLILVILLSGLSILFIIFSGFSGSSKYSILGCIRIISQVLSFELMFTTIILILIWSWNDLSIGSYFFFCTQPYIDLSLLLFLLISFFPLYFSLIFLLNVFDWINGNNHLAITMFFICILAESNRVPFDLPEAESELVAGFITEYSSIYFSFILLTEYGNIIAMSFWMIILFSIFPVFVLLVLFFVCWIRSTLNRLKFDELMTNAWIVILPILFFSLLSLLFIL